MKSFFKIQFKHKVILIMCLFTLAPILALSGLAVKRMWDEKVKDILTQNEILLKSGTESINALLLSGQYKVSFINMNDDIIHYLTNTDFTNILETMTAYGKIYLTVNALLVGEGLTAKITIYPLDQQAKNIDCVENINRLESRLANDDLLFFQNLLSANPGEYIWRRGTDLNEPFLYCYKKMLSLSQTIAITEYRVNVNRVIELLSGEFPSGSIITFQPDAVESFVYSRDVGQADWHIKTCDISDFETDKYFLIENKLSVSNGIVCVYIPRANINDTLRPFLFTLILSVVFLVLILFFAEEMAVRLLTRRLTKLIDTVNTIVENDDMRLIEQSERFPKDDIGRMEEKIYGMLMSVQDYYQKILKYENEKKSFEMELLQSYINPHFLYNSLSSLRWNANNKKMTDLIDAMVAYYRLSLGKGDFIVSVSQEISLIEEYLKIQKVVYEADFTYHFDLDEGAMECVIIKNVLQPLVENAILHGLMGMKSAGEIIVTTRLTDGRLILSVTDNGLGMSDETLKKVLAEEFAGKIGGYGIKNIRKRIQVYYGSEGELEIFSKPNKGTTATISIAVRMVQCK